jgi:EAL domain-containing protein (putative c-di-GMP-specific phosphodiesterase class I)
VVERLRLESDLRKAIARRELALHYQPIMSATGAQAVGCEALVRWVHHERGLIAPDRFIGIAEECGLIRNLGAWVLEEACRQIEAWTAAGLHVLPVAVNVSADQLAHGDEFVDLVSRLMRKHGVGRGCLEIEITESALMRNVDGAVALLRRLSGMGIALKIDDFGTGYSSLAYLKRLPIDALKIDRAFVRDIERDSGDAQIVRAMLLMAEGLGKRVIAEGVENEGQMSILRALRCEEFQGFLFSRPLAADDYARRFLRERGTASG